MHIKRFLYLFIIISFFSCSEKDELPIETNLQDYIKVHSDRELDNVITCAASDIENKHLSYVFYYPVEGATAIQYYESENASIDPNDFSNYKKIELEQSDVFGGKLKRFLRTNSEESWCVVTYLTEGKLHKSNPIRLKNDTKPTEWTDAVVLDSSQPLMPRFSWSDGTFTDSNIYFQVISRADDSFISGTYTTEKTFQFYNISNIVLNITDGIPNSLITGEQYNFTLMGVSEDNWVNLVIQKAFIVE